MIMYHTYYAPVVLFQFLHQFRTAGQVEVPRRNQFQLSDSMFEKLLF